MRILINTPDTSLLGGVANHYKGLKPYWSEQVDYHLIGGRRGIPGIVLLPIDLAIFYFKLLFRSYDAVLLNPSLGKTAIKRDALFLRVASFFKLKKLVFFHGWDQSLAEAITIEPTWFKKHYHYADAFVVLASAFKAQLESWNIGKPVILSTTKFDDALIKDFDGTNRDFNNTLLFLARIEEGKGIFVALEALNILQKRWPQLRMVVAGNGSALIQAQQYVREQDIRNVEFLGNVSGSRLVSAFTDSDIYILPTWHGEGMPTSVLEAMAFGLPVITRPVGGLVDFFETGKMGVLIESRDPEDFARAISEYLENKPLYAKVSAYNSQFASETFMASKVAKSLEGIIREL